VYAKNESVAIKTPSGVDFDEAWNLITRQAPREDSGLRHLLFASLILGQDQSTAQAIGRDHSGKPLTRKDAEFITTNWSRDFNGD
jgi:hypothetical protein